MTRRGFLAASAVAGAGLMGGRIEAAPFHTKLQKAMIAKPTEKNLREHKEAGFDGLETSDWNVSPDDAEQARKRAEQLGMKIHSVLFGWANFNHPDKLAADLANVEKALKSAAAYGASALLLVPCRVGGMAIPEAWEFDIEFDQRTGHVTRVLPRAREKRPGVTSVVRV
jgi:hexulose-6-phosphate isomerase